MKILVFLHGTVIMHSGALGKPRDIRVKQVEGKHPSVLEYENYVPVGNAVDKLNSWVEDGAQILYLSSHKFEGEVEKDKRVLRRFNFPAVKVFWRKGGESYSDIAERIKPEVFVEDDCESIGGKKEMTYTFIKPEIKKDIKLISVKEFVGIDSLPDTVEELINY